MIREKLMPGTTIYRVAANIDDRPLMITRVVKSVASVYATLVRPSALDARGERSPIRHVCATYSLGKRDALLAFVAAREAEIDGYRRRIGHAQNAAIEAAAMLKALDTEPAPSAEKEN